MFQLPHGKIISTYFIKKFIKKYVNIHKKYVTYYPITQFLYMNWVNVRHYIQGKFIVCQLHNNKVIVLSILDFDDFSVNASILSVLHWKNM